MRCFRRRRVLPFVAIFLIFILLYQLKFSRDEFEDKFKNDIDDFKADEMFIEKRTQVVPIDYMIKRIERTSIQASTVGRDTQVKDDTHPMKMSDSSHVTIYRRLGTSWTRDINICKSLPIMTIEAKNSPIGSLQLYRMGDDHEHETELSFDGKILIDRIWDDVSDALYKVLAPDRGIFLLDVGVDCGGYTYMAAQMGHRVIAVESSVDRVKEVCKSTERNNMANLVTIIHLNMTDKNSDLIQNENVDKNINLDNEVVCSDRTPFTFRLEHVIELSHIRKYTKIVVRFDTLMDDVTTILICGEEFFLHFDVEAVIMPWSDVNDKDRVSDFFKQFHMSPFSADGFLSRLQSRDFEYWPMNVLWRKDSESR